MDMLSRYSADHIVESAAMEDEICGFVPSWSSHIWSPQYLIDIKAFSGTEFPFYLETLNSDVRPVTP